MSIGFAHLPSGVEFLVCVSIAESLDVVVAVHGQLHGVGTGPVGEGEGVYLLAIYKSPHHDGSCDRAGIVDRAGYGGVLFDRGFEQVELCHLTGCEGAVVDSQVVD